MDYSNEAQAIHRILEINKQLPADQKIRVISMSTGLNPAFRGYDDALAAINEAREAGIFPITVSLDTTYGRIFWDWDEIRSPLRKISSHIDLPTGGHRIFLSRELSNLHYSFQ